MTAIDPELRRRADRVRRFNRFYTKHIGVLSEGLLESQFSLAQVRVLYELAHQPGPITATALAAALALDPGYLSRMLRGFEADGLILRRPSPEDARQQAISLTAAGRETLAPLEERSTREVAEALDRLAPAAQEQVVSAMQTLERLLGPPAKSVGYTLRNHEPGDMGWVISRHGAIYAREYGWTLQFEGLVAEIAAAFLRDFDPARERCWIAESDGVNLGCVFLVNAGDGVAKLRLLLVEPAARGLGIGRRLVEECVAFARRTGYRKLTLWTQSNLLAARKLYADAGFRLIQAVPNRAFGAELISETWDLEL